MLDLPRYPQFWQPGSDAEPRVIVRVSSHPSHSACLLISMMAFVGTFLMAAVDWEGLTATHRGHEIGFVAVLVTFGLLLSWALALKAATSIHAGWLLLAGEAVLGVLLVRLIAAS